MSNPEKIREIIQSPNWDETEKSVVKWQFGLHGDFKKSLWQTISRADDDNLDKLFMAFPIEVTGYRAWTRGDLAARLRATGLLI